MDIESTISKVVKNFDKSYGVGTATSMKMWETQGYAPTGLLALDYIIGRPGWPLGRFSEIAGPFSSGKSAIMGQTIGASQRAGMFPILLDLEHSYDPIWLQLQFGVNPEQLLLLQPPDIESVFDQLKSAIKVIREVGNTAPLIAIVDSVSSQPSHKEIERTDGTESKQMAEHAKIISSGCRQLTPIIKKESVGVVFVSQLRDNPGQMYGANSHKLGGKAINFHAGLLVESRRRTFIKHGKEDISGFNLIIDTKKNKYAPPFRKAQMEYNFDGGFNRESMLIEFMARLGMLQKSGGWFSYEGTKYRKEDLTFLFSEAKEKEVYEALGISADATYEDYIKSLKNTKAFALNKSKDSDEEEDDEEAEEEDYEEEVDTDLED